MQHHSHFFVVTTYTTYVPLILLAVAVQSWLWWGLWHAGEEIRDRYRQVRRRLLVRSEERRRDEERLLARYWSAGQPLTSTAPRPRASNRANLPRETPCAPSSSPQPLCSP